MNGYIRKSAIHWSLRRANRNLANFTKFFQKITIFFLTDQKVCYILYSIVRYLRFQGHFMAIGQFTQTHNPEWRPATAGTCQSAYVQSIRLNMADYLRKGVLIS